MPDEMQPLLSLVGGLIPILLLLVYRLLLAAGLVRFDATAPTLPFPSIHQHGGFLESLEPPRRETA